MRTKELRPPIGWLGYTGGPLGVRDDEFTGLITIDLVDIADQDPSPESAVFADGQISVSDLGFADAVTVDIFAAGGDSFQIRAGERVSVIGPGGSVELRINNGADGDSVSLMVRGFRGSADNTIRSQCATEPVTYY